MSRALCVFVCSVSVTLCAGSAAAQAPTFWPDSIRPGVVYAEGLRDSLRAVVSTPVEVNLHGMGLTMADRALRDLPGDPELTCLRARILYALDRWQEAIDALEPLIAEDPRGAFATEAALVLGVAYTRLERYEDAARAYEVFLAEEVWPRRRAIALTNLGETHIARGQLEEALACFRSALAADSDYSLAYFGLGVVLDRIGEYSRARDAMVHGLASGPGIVELSHPDVFYVPEWEVHYYRALAQEVLGDDGAALVEWRAFLDGGGDSGPYAEIVEQHIRRLSQ